MLSDVNPRMPPGAPQGGPAAPPPPQGMPQGAAPAGAPGEPGAQQAPGNSMPGGGNPLTDLIAGRLDDLEQSDLPALMQGISPQAAAALMKLLPEAGFLWEMIGGNGAPTAAPGGASGGAPPPAAASPAGAPAPTATAPMPQAAPGEQPARSSLAMI